jgi:hypothetical protein
MTKLSLAAPLLALLAARGSALVTLTLQPCEEGAAVEDLSVAGGSVRDGNGMCVTDAGGGGLSMAPCGAGASQQFTFNSDGTVASASSAGQCWNADGGSVNQGTPVVLYACGSAIAANDIFWPLPAWGAAKSPRVLGNESGLCVSTAALPPPPPPPPSNGSCATDLDCSLSGTCSAGVCACYAPWTAALDCSALKFLPSPVQRGYPPAAHNETTWGGSIALDPVGGLYHMYVAEMMNECPLSTWGQNSRCTHAVSATPEGPYAFADVAVTNWCHNPAIVLKTQPDGSQLWVLFHIGDGSGGSTQNCSQSEVLADASSEAAAVPTAGSTLHVAASPNGPFTPAQPLPSCNNPAPFLHKNGTMYCVCDGFELYRTEDVQAQPWVHVTHIAATGTPISGNYEDPFFFIDPRGQWHIIYHVYRTGGASAHNCTPGEDGAVVSGHYFSPDGLTWHTSPTMPYINVVDLADGTSQLLTTRERPKMIFNAAGDPTHLSNGVCPSPGNWKTPISCPDVSTGCVDCKYSFWDFTNVSPLDT